MMGAMSLSSQEPAAPARPGLRGPVLAAAGVAAAFAVTAAVDPNQPGHYPTCPFLWTTGYVCPGCGTLRAMHALAHGDLATALHRNPLFILSLVIGGVLWLRWLRHAATGQRYLFAWPRSLQVIVPVVVLGYWVIRNIPGFGFLGPY